MSEEFVADASVAMAWAVESQSSPQSKALLDRVAAGVPFVVPVLWPFEVANGLLVLLRRKRMTPQDFARICRDFEAAKPVIDAEGPRLLWHEVTDLAEKFGLTIYDAAYLELAIRRRLALASRDASLNDAARLCGVKNPALTPPSPLPANPDRPLRKRYHE